MLDPFTFSDCVNGRRALLVAGLLLGGMGATDAPSDVSPPGFYERFQSALPVQTPDRAIRVFGREVDSGERMRLLRLTEEWKVRFARFTGIPITLLPTDLLVIPGDAPMRDDSVQIFDDDGGGGARAWLRVPLLTREAALRDRLCEGWLRLWWGYRGLDPPPPPFLAPGLARHLEATHRLADAESVLARWSTARLPGIARLIRDAVADPRADPALASQLSLFLLYGDSRSRRMLDMASPVSGIEANSPAWVSRLLLGLSDLSALDNLWDRWLLERGAIVLAPGALSAGMLERFRAQLLIYPGESGTPLVKPLIPGFTFELLIAYREAPWALTVADDKVVALLRYAGGRHEELQSVAAGYVAFLGALRQDLPEDALRERLRQADDQLKRLVRAVIAGGIESD